jgi:hypothetical protein
MDEVAGSVPKPDPLDTGVLENDTLAKTKSNMSLSGNKSPERGRGQESKGGGKVASWHSDAEGEHRPLDPGGGKPDLEDIDEIGPMFPIKDSMSSNPTPDGASGRPSNEIFSISGGLQEPNADSTKNSESVSDASDLEDFRVPVHSMPHYEELSYLLRVVCQPEIGNADATSISKQLETCTFQYRYQASLADRCKLALEAYSGWPWLWRPFESPKPTLPDGMARLHWECVSLAFSSLE